MSADTKENENKELTEEEKYLKDWLVQKLRRLSYQWPPRKEAKRAARVSRGKYKCAICEGEEFGPKQIVMDHIEPVIDPEEGFIDFNIYLKRLFCKKELFQVLCKSCHTSKTYLENEIRKQVRNEKAYKDEDYEDI